MPELNEMTPAELDYAVAEAMEPKPKGFIKRGMMRVRSSGGWWYVAEGMRWAPVPVTSDPAVAAELRQMARDAGLLVGLVDTDLTTRCNIIDLDAVRSISAVSPQGEECRATAIATLEAMRKWPDIAWKQAKGEG